MRIEERDEAEHYLESAEPYEFLVLVNQLEWLEYNASYKAIRGAVRESRLQIAQYGKPRPIFGIDLNWYTSTVGTARRKNRYPD